MEIFGMGPLEILVILIVALMVFGPGKLPRLARNLGQGVAALRKATKDLTGEMSRELEELEREGKDLVEEDRTAARKPDEDGKR